MNDVQFLRTLQDVITARLSEDPGNSYTARLAQQGVMKVAQKLGEEGVELALAAAAQGEDRVTAEAADLLYHLLVLLKLRGLEIGDVMAELERRHSAGGEPA